MTKQQWIAVFRAGSAVAILVAIVVLFVDRSSGSAFRAVNFFSFFTIQGNIFAMLVLLYGAIRAAGIRPLEPRDWIRGAALLYLSLTGVVYGLLLSGYQEALQTTIPWVDTVLHRLIPLVMVIDWIVDPPTTRLNLRDALWWLAYPAVWLAYSLVRGPIVDWYPYPFLDPDSDVTGGPAGVAVYCVGIALGVLLATWLIVWVNRRWQEPEVAPQPG